MNSGRRRLILAVVAVLGLSACASIPENIIAKPQVKLRDVQVVGLGFKNQTFLLSFDIHNPNPFSLPVNHVSYDVRLDGLRFASGQTDCDISVPARGDGEFAMSVELDLLTTAPRLLSIIRDGVRSDIPYELEGELGIDLPLTPAVTYSGGGSIHLGSGGF